jgi:hypothetical protein
MRQVIMLMGLWPAAYCCCRWMPEAMATVVLGVLLALPVVAVLVVIDRAVMDKGE